MAQNVAVLMANTIRAEDVLPETINEILKKIVRGQYFLVSTEEVNFDHKMTTQECITHGRE